MNECWTKYCTLFRTEKDSQPRIAADRIENRGKKKLSEAPTQFSFHHTDSFSAYKQIKEQPFLVQETKTIPPVNKWGILEIKFQFYLIQTAIRRYNLYVYKAQSSLN